MSIESGNQSNNLSETPEGQGSLFVHLPKISGTDTVSHRFDDFIGMFEPPFAPDTRIVDIDPEYATVAGLGLIRNGYAMQRSQGVSEACNRTVASLLLDLGIGNRITGKMDRTLEELQESGAKIGPVVMAGIEGRAFYSSGVGLWLPKPIVTYEA